MRKTLITLALIALLPVLAVPAAEAGVFSVGASFDVGGFFFDLGFGGPRYSVHAGRHVYRVSEPFHYSGYQCHSGCYRGGGYSYHHADCPAVAYHFRSHRFDPYVSYSGFFAPRAYGGHTYGTYGRYGSRYDHYRYDRYRYDRHRYDRHRSYRNYGRDYYRPRHDDRRHHGRHYRSDSRNRHHSDRFDRDRRGHSDRGAYSTRSRGQRRDLDRGRGGDRNRDRARSGARRARPRGHD